MDMKSTINELQEDFECLISHFAWRIGRCWEDLDISSTGSVGMIYKAQELAEEFLAIWESGILKTLEDYDDSWEFYIDEYFDLFLSED